MALTTTPETMIETLFKHGDVRSDGKRFREYKKRGGQIVEEWENPATWERRVERNRVRVRLRKRLLRAKAREERVGGKGLQ